MKLSKDSVDRIVSAFESVELGDPRRAERLETTLRRLAEAPRSTTPEAMVTEADLEGAYRFFRSPHVKVNELMRAQAESAAARAKKVGRVLAIHDSTTCQFAHASASEVGYLPTGKAGFIAHYTLLVSYESNERMHRPLGVANAETIVRDRPPARASKNGRKLRNKDGAQSAKDPNRESLRWSRGFLSTNEALRACSEVIHIADREGDSYELLSTVDKGLRFVIRCRQPERRAVSEDGGKSSVKALAEAAKGQFTRTVDLSTRLARPEPRARKEQAPRTSRKAVLSFSATRVEIRRPHYLLSFPETIVLNMVHVLEESAPAGEKPVEWFLYTTEPISSQAAIEEIVDMYRARWLIEECNKAIKTGCRYEERQFESRQALLNLLALTFPIACELLWLRACCRADKQMPANRVLTETQLQILRALGRYKLAPNPTAHDALWAVAGLGGHIRSNGEPGWLVLHRGLTKLLAYEAGWRAREKRPGVPISR